MKYLLLIFLTLLLSVNAFSQKIHTVYLENDKIEIPNRNFFIREIEDNRAIKSSIGIVQKGAFNKKVIADFDQSLDKTLLDYFNNALPDNGNMTPLKMVVIKLEISERTSFSSEVAYADLSVEFYYENSFLFSTYEQTESKGLDVTNQHGENIKLVLKKAITTFSSTNWQSKINQNDPKSLNPDYIVTEENQPESNSLEDRKSSHTLDVGYKNPKKDRNVTAIGYQIGGWTLIGVDYEFRVHDYFGLHMGTGLYGWTAGVKFHTNDDKNSPFFNLSIKDGGFGLIKTVGAEYGGRLVFVKNKDIALHTQIGIARLIQIDESFENNLFGNEEAPDWWLTLGIGISW